jgi:hypothetical protein
MKNKWSILVKESPSGMICLYDVVDGTESVAAARARLINRVGKGNRYAWYQLAGSPLPEGCK